LAGQRGDRSRKTTERETETPEKQKDHGDRETTERPQDDVIEETGRRVVKRRN